MELRIKFGSDSFEEKDFVYIWLETMPVIMPFYVGQSGKSLSDRVGLHIRKCGDELKSGATAARIICRLNKPEQEYIVKSFEIPSEIIGMVVNENKEKPKGKPKRNAREAIEFGLYSALVKAYPGIHKVKKHAWTCKSANDFIKTIKKDISLCKQ